MSRKEFARLLIQTLAFGYPLVGAFGVYLWLGQGSVVSVETARHALAAGVLLGLSSGLVVALGIVASRNR